MANDIFISYRSSDQRDVELLYDGLIKVGGFDRSQVYRDRTSLAAGHGWSRQLEDAIARATAFLAVIGPTWASTNSDDDWVTRELRAAFRHHVPVIPILLRGTQFPAGAALAPGLEGLSEPHAVTVEDPGSVTSVFDVAAALRRNGIRAARETDPWAHASRFLEIEKVLRELSDAVSIKVEAPKVVLLTGPAGSGRSTALRSFCSNRPEGAFTGLHASLRTSAERDCPVLDDWLNDIFEHARSSPDRLRQLGECLVRSDLARQAGHLLPRGDVAAFLPIDLRLALLHACQASVSCEANPADPRLPLPLATTLVQELSSTIADVGLILAVDDFDDADAKSREFVRELIGSTAGRAANVHLLLSTSDVIATNRFLGLTDCPTVDTKPNMLRFIGRCLALEGSAVEADELGLHLLEECHTPFEVETMLRHLYRVGSIARSADGRWSFAQLAARDRTTVREAIAATIDLVLSPPMQQLLEKGALVGMSFAADLADVVSDPATITDAADDTPTLWQEIQKSDRDESIVRCRVVGGRRAITFTSSVWQNHVRGRVEKEELERRTLALGQRYAIQAGHQYGDWVNSAQLLERVGHNGAAGRSYLSSARLARQQLSLDVAARRYRDAAASLSLAALSGGVTTRARALMETSFALIQAASLRYWSYRLKPTSNAPATPPATTQRPILPPEFATELEAAQTALSQFHRAMDDVPVTPTMLDVEKLVLDLSDSHLSDVDRLAMRAHSLSAHLAILKGHGSPRPQGHSPERGEEEAERHYAGALRDAEQGLGGQVRRFLVVLASAGLTEILTTKAERLVSDPQDQDALRNVVATALFHASRALLILHRWDDPPIDQLHATQRHMARADVEACLDRLAHVSRQSDKQPLRLRDPRGGDGNLTAIEVLVESWSRTLSPDAHDHATKVEKFGRRLARAMGDNRSALPVCRQEDVTIVALAHDLFGRVEPSRVLALFRELDVPNTISRRGREEWISCAEWSTPILLHGRLAALFLELVLDARNRLGADRFRAIEQALTNHTTGQEDPLPLARVLFVADTLELLAHDATDDTQARNIRQAALDHPDLDRAYGFCLAARVRLLDDIGRTPATDTLDAVKSMCPIPPDQALPHQRAKVATSN